MTDDSAYGKGRATSRWRVWLYRAASVFLVPALVLFLLELGLRVAGYGDPAAFFQRRSVQGSERFLSNPGFSRVFFPPQLRRECLPFSLPVHKDADTVRIFLLGGSAANGVPEPAYGMARILETMLQDRFPGVQIEVVNVAITAINSHVVRSIARACRRLDPDMFLVYMGNNEVVGPYGAGTVFAPLAKSQRMIHLDIAVKSTRLGQLVRDVARRLLGTGHGQPAGWQGMEMFLANQVRASDPRMQLVYRHFEQNLRDVCDLATSSKFPLLISTVGVNLKDCGPFGSLHREGLSPEQTSRWDALYARGRDRMASRDFAGAMEAYRQAEAIDGEYAELQFVMGRCLQEQGEIEAARARFERARDLDTLRFRADSRIEEILRRVAVGREAEGVHLVDAQAALAAASPGGTTGQELFFEHVHLDFAGNYRVARAFFQPVCDALPEAIRRRGRDAPVLEEQECARRLAYTPFDRDAVIRGVRTMIEHPPFVGQVDHRRQLAHVDSLLARNRVALEGPDALKAMEKTYETALLDPRAPWLLRHRYANFRLEALGDATGAERQWRRLVAELPQFPMGYSYLAGALARQKRYAEALRLWRRSLSMNRYQADVHNNIANCLLLLHPGDRDARREAIDHYRAAYRIAPSEDARRNLDRALFDEGLWLLQQEQWAQAKTILEEIVDAEPDFVEAQFNLATLLAQEGDREGALRHYAEVLRVMPDHEEARRRMESLQR